jgi:hypothetical protein
MEKFLVVLRRVDGSAEPLTTLYVHCETLARAEQGGQTLMELNGYTGRYEAVGAIHVKRQKDVLPRLSEGIPT